MPLVADSNRLAMLTVDPLGPYFNRLVLPEFPTWATPV